MIKAANSPAFQELAKNSGFTIAPMDHIEFTDYLAEENAKVEAIFKSAGLYKSQ
jgi:tripartite-type tricarboxylate transporter receptor subunit TctC